MHGLDLCIVVVSVGRGKCSQQEELNSLWLGEPEPVPLQPHNSCLYMSLVHWNSIVV